MATGLPMLAASVAVGVDLGLINLKKLELQRAADMAALAGIQDLSSTTTAKTKATEGARLNMSQAQDGAVLLGEDVELGIWDGATKTFKVSVNGANAVRVRTRRAEANGNAFPLQFVRLLGFYTVDLTAEAIATVAGRELELALVLDVSGSMKETLEATTAPADDDGTSLAVCKGRGIVDDDHRRHYPHHHRHGPPWHSAYWRSGCGDDAPPPPTVVETKIQVLRRVARNLVDALAETDPAGSNVRVGIVPFAGRVNIGRPGTSWMSSMGAGTASRLCTDQRTGGSDTLDDPPSVRLFPPFTLNSYACPESRALGLTTDMAQVRDAIASLTAGGSTNTDVGMVWGWRVLSERWQGLWGEANRPAAFDDSRVQKAVVIMTDGENTPHQTGDDYTTGQADARLRQECRDMKVLGVRIFTVTFDAPNSIEDLYRQCASGPDDLFSPATAGELETAFGSIGKSLATRTALVH